MHPLPAEGRESGVTEEQHDPPTTAQEPVAAPESRPAPGPKQHTIERTRVSSLYVAIAVGMLFAIAVLVFIAQNSRQVEIKFLWAQGRISLALGLLFAALCGAFAVLVPGAWRISQLRRTAKRHSKGDADR